MGKEITDEMVRHALNGCTPNEIHKISIIAKEAAIGGLSGTGIGSLAANLPGAIVGGLVGVALGVFHGHEDANLPDPNCVADILQQNSQEKIGR